MAVPGAYVGISTLALLPSTRGISAAAAVNASKASLTFKKPLPGCRRYTLRMVVGRQSQDPCGVPLVHTNRA
jgi:hypothetical protein